MQKVQRLEVVVSLPSASGNHFPCVWVAGDFTWSFLNIMVIPNVGLIITSCALLFKIPVVKLSMANHAIIPEHAWWGRRQVDPQSLLVRQYN